MRLGTRKIKTCSGSALVIVLASLAFLAALALAFLASIGTELKSSKRYADGVSAQLLAQSTFNLAIAQITEATKGVDNANNTLAWASQPGMIRTYDSNGIPQIYYKLYSWDKMQGTGTFDPYLNPLLNPDVVSTSWFNTPAIYADLNQPIQVLGIPHYPIVDGGSLKNLAGLPAGAKTYDANNDNTADIDGFYIAGNAPLAPSTGANPVPMPVKWLYVLENGEIVTAAPTANLREARVSGATASNPIVGRIAFWADDDSSKININTASEGLYWDMPRAKTDVEDAIKTNQPVTGEYQRYPGHPAMTCLSTVFKKPNGSGLTDAQWAQFLYTIVPRVKDGGSKAGTTNTAWAATPADQAAISPDSDRLYTSVDELMFDPNRSSNATVSGSSQILNKTTLERAKFFLSASSRSPDVNLFNQPRICVWPITLDRSSGTPMTTAFDKLIAFCTTMRNGDYRYYFTRKDPTSPTVDLPAAGTVQGLGRNRMLLDYLRGLAGKPIPGFGGSFAEKYESDTDQILVEIFDYIRAATNLVDPSQPAAQRYAAGGLPGGFNGDFLKDRYGEGQVVPIEDSTSVPGSDLHGFGRYRTIQGASLLFIGQVDGDDPLVPQDKFHVAIPPFPADTSQVDVTTGKSLPTATVSAVAPGNRRIQAIFIPQFFCPSVGMPWNISNFQWSVDLSNLKWGASQANSTDPIDPGTSMGFPAATSRYFQNTSEDRTAFGDQFGLLQVTRMLRPGPVKSSTVDVPKSTGTFHFLGGDVIITIYGPSTAYSNPPPSTTVVQTITMHFDAGDFPLPSLSKKVYNWINYSPPIIDPDTFPYNYRSFDVCTGFYNPADPNSPLPCTGGRTKAKNDQAEGWILNADVIRSVQVKSGDTRLVAARKVVSKEMFQPNAKYNSSEGVRGTHNFFDAYGRPYYGAALGRLVAGLDYLAYKPNKTTFPGVNELNSIDNSPRYVFNLAQYTLASDIPLDGVAVGKSTSFAAGDIPGDWDNGPFTVRDGPFINKADEGDRSNATNIAPYDWKLAAKAGGGLSLTMFTPNREIPSAVMLGSLPTGVLAGRPWQTLLFRPEPGHPGSRNFKGDGTASAGMPADHLLLDLFHMPVVEPYAISEPLSTAGRINMNYQMVPFTYLNRDTGIRALLKSEKVISIRDSQAIKYKDGIVTGQANIRLEVNVDETLKGFNRRFNPVANGLPGGTPDIFRSASEICELYVVPVDAGNPNASYQNMAAYWSDSSNANGRRLTGDNSKERIYATLYPRLTTKSNVFTIHARVQTLKKVTGDPKVWTEGLDQVAGEYRGYQTIERYIDPNNSALPDFAAAGGSNTPISTFYKTRVVTTKTFAP